jgi:hypothetical protein
MNITGFTDFIRLSVSLVVGCEAIYERTMLKKKYSLDSLIRLENDDFFG